MWNINWNGIWQSGCCIIREHLHSAIWYMRDCSEDNSISDMMRNEIRYLDVTFVTSRRARARWRLLQSVRILSWVEIDFAIALIAPRSIEYSPLFRTRIYQTDRDAREEAEYEKSPLVNHRVTLCVYSCASRLTGVTYFFFSSARVLLALETKIKKQVERGRKCVFFHYTTIF